mmetsp:Transcript_92783/g.262029  ORF Transcript_92783/g.262029 Transcript_92783/m.262029 type:complete len:238 (+) Transcript_92783:552-1265(+)
MAARASFASWFISSCTAAISSTEASLSASSSSLRMSSNVASRSILLGLRTRFLTPLPLKSNQNSIQKQAACSIPRMSCTAWRIASENVLFPLAMISLTRFLSLTSAIRPSTASERSDVANVKMINLSNTTLPKYLPPLLLMPTVGAEAGSLDFVDGSALCPRVAGDRKYSTKPAKVSSATVSNNFGHALGSLARNVSQTISATTGDRSDGPMGAVSTGISASQLRPSRLPLETRSES